MGFTTPFAAASGIRLTPAGRGLPRIHSPGPPRNQRTARSVLTVALRLAEGRRGKMAAPSKSEDATPTILLAEDEQHIRELLSRVFEDSGFTVLIAKDAREALQVAEQHAGPIHLLVSDVQMPNMTGPDLARELKRHRPDLRVLLISGYPQGVLLLDEGWYFLRKPFLPGAIVEKVRELLGKPPNAFTDRGTPRN